MILDVRRDQEWDHSHLAGAVHIPIHQLPARLADAAGADQSQRLARKLARRRILPGHGQEMGARLHDQHRDRPDRPEPRKPGLGGPRGNQSTLAKPAAAGPAPVPAERCGGVQALLPSQFKSGSPQRSEDYKRTARTVAEQ